MRGRGGDIIPCENVFDVSVLFQILAKLVGCPNTISRELHIEGAFTFDERRGRQTISECLCGSVYVPGISEERKQNEMKRNSKHHQPNGLASEDFK